MKHVISFVLLFFCAVPVGYACSLSGLTTANIREIVNANGGWPISEEKCAYLNSQNLAIQVDGNATAIGNTSIAWTVVRVVNPISDVVSNASKGHTEVNTSSASQEKADSMMYDAIRQALNGLDLQLAARQVKDAIPQ